MKEVSPIEGEYSEFLASIAMDGNILLWSIQNGFESSPIMQLKRISSKKNKKVKTVAASSSQPAKKATKPNNEKKKNKQSAEKLSRMNFESGQNYMITHHAPGMGLAFSQKDPNM